MKILTGYILKYNGLCTGKVQCHNSIAELNNWLEAKDLVMHRMWAGIIPVMVVTPRADGYHGATAYDWKGNVVLQASFCLFGRTDDDQMCSLTNSEINKISDMIYITGSSKGPTGKGLRYVMRGLNTKFETDMHID